MVEQNVTITSKNAPLLEPPPDQRIYLNRRIVCVAILVIGLITYWVVSRVQSLMSENNLTMAQAFQAFGKEILSFFSINTPEERIIAIAIATLGVGGGAVLIHNAVRDKIRLIRFASAVRNNPESETGSTDKTSLEPTSQPKEILTRTAFLENFRNEKDLINKELDSVRKKYSNTARVVKFVNKCTQELKDIEADANETRSGDSDAVKWLNARLVSLKDEVLQATSSEIDPFETDKLEKIIEVSHGNVVGDWRRVELRCRGQKRRGHIEMSGVPKTGTCYVPVYENQNELASNLVSAMGFLFCCPWYLLLPVPIEMRAFLFCANYGGAVSIYYVARSVFIGPYIAYRMIREKMMTPEERARLKDRLFKLSDFKEIPRSLGCAIKAPFNGVAMTFTLMYSLLIDPLNGRKWTTVTEEYWNHSSPQNGTTPLNRGIFLSTPVGGWEFEGGGHPSTLGSNGMTIMRCRKPIVYVKTVDGEIVDVQSPSGKDHFAIAIEAREGDYFIKAERFVEETGKPFPKTTSVAEPTCCAPFNQTQFQIFSNEERMGRDLFYAVTNPREGREDLEEDIVISKHKGKYIEDLEDEHDAVRMPTQAEGLEEVLSEQE